MSMSGSTAVLVERAKAMELREHIRVQHRRLESSVIPVLDLDELERLHNWLVENESDCQEALW